MIAVLGVSLIALLAAVLAGAAARERSTTDAAAPATRAVRSETGRRPVADRGRAAERTATTGDIRLLDARADLPALARSVDPSGRRGRLLAAQPVLPPPVGTGAAYRVLYGSVAVDGRPVVVSGVVYVPAGRAPKGGWPLVSWARGTSGTADRCAPSRWVGTDLVPIALAQEGFAVAATDYEGLGTPGLHPYLVGESEGRSVLDIVPAAGGIPGLRLQRTYSVWGHSQGGHAALFARELAASWLPGRQLVGTVAIAPPSFLPQAVDAWATKVRAKGLGLMALAGLSATYPEAHLDALVRPEHLPALLDVLENGCTDDVSRRFAEVSGTELFTSPPAETEPWASLLHAQEPAQRAGTGPVLLVQGGQDGTLPPEMSAAVEAQMCARDEPVQRWLLPGVGHGEVINAAWDAMSGWTRDRLAGRAPGPTTCADGVDAPPAD